MPNGTLHTAVAEPDDPDDYLKGYTEGYRARKVPPILICARAALAAPYAPSWAIGYLDGATHAIATDARIARAIRRILRGDYP